METDNNIDNNKVIKYKKNRYFKLTKEIVNYVLFPILILITWELISKLKIVPSILLPSIGDVIKSFISQIKSGQLINDLTTSLIRVFKGYFIAVILGITMGIIMGISEKTNKFFTIVFNGIRQIPPLAWIPLFILWFGIGETSKVIMIAIGAFFSILLNTINGIKNTPKQYLEVAKLYKIKKIDLFKKVYLPSAVPSIFVGLRLGAGSSWMSVVAAEMIASSSGIGYRINDARSLMQPDVVIVGIIVIGTVGILMDTLLRRIAHFASRWERF
ncbi:sulfonate transport system permease protein [Clostridium algifaecis]|uniref:Sulfonate transport system permease protein n=1 Tax=Clostridium algifaecis TaxID=1472040 RepID=A0ABS4KSD6_9CLOT|nr:ABC transporter permease [Clostridium algifaecis]MBP2032953.1 sulfonate transport system permease protein [Clostridium algifaecis]